MCPVFGNSGAGFNRRFASPAMAALLWQTYLQDDVRDLLGSVSVPTLVMARPGDHMVPYEAQAALASGIPNAQFVTLPPGEHGAFDLVDVIVEHNVELLRKTLCYNG